ncbi:CREB-regulated transcription coactivator 2 [Wickerhamomyces ciferrii]|uniref:CREB-regulated transcription coactivator 2 n=1 Tax=Wickerhamomyces ciferrii (strain ATCC 14091 / BCRC 22168 / CBS 111 / JCM 3599 / NBRC 0793 / NRRL Y-1031 F-60-10) TaxID=1206466 RepID=K0KDS0_WICCF|nr:CREB-regulated transcription coactivator 2 [Wickerhamomyces ciferrii]CCH41071.1 CREB-regulated transcription coactivator 2 [Wickerhamomyces ciferrii]
MGSSTTTNPNSYVGIDIDNMIKGKFKKTILRRDSDNSAFRPSQQQQSQQPQSQSQPTTPIDQNELISITRPPPRTKDDESIFINTGVITPIAVESPPKLSRKTTNGSTGYGKTSASAQYFPTGDETPYSYAPSIHSNKSYKSEARASNNVEDFIDGLNIGMIGDFLKKIMNIIWDKLQKSPYINTENDGKLHLQSFFVGIIMTSIVVMVQPYLVGYLDSWIVLLGRLFKHLMAWVMVAGVLSYVFKTKKNDDDDSRSNNFDQMTVKTNKTRSSSPTKSFKSKKTHRDRPNLAKHQIPSLIDPTLPQSNQELNQITTNKSMNQDQLMLMNITEQTQEDEFERFENNGIPTQLSDGFPQDHMVPNNNYNEFMKIAIEKDQQHQQYNKFIDDNRKGIKKMVKVG